MAATMIALPMFYKIISHRRLFPFFLLNSLSTFFHFYFFLCLSSTNENSSFLSTNAAVSRGTDRQAPRDSVVKKVACLMINANITDHHYCRCLPSSWVWKASTTSIDDAINDDCVPVRCYVLQGLAYTYTIGSRKPPSSPLCFRNSLVKITSKNHRF